VRKYSSSGSEVWTRQFGTAFSLDNARGVAVDETGVYVVGSVSAFALPGQVIIGLTDAFIRKYSLDGVELWTRQFGTVSNDQGLGVATGGGSVYVVGSVAGAFPGHVNAGSNDAYVRAYDQNGTALWTSQFGTSGMDSALAVSADVTGVYVAGFVNGQALAGPPPDRQASSRSSVPTASSCGLTSSVLTIPLRSIMRRPWLRVPAGSTSLESRGRTERC
jgi:hypothetical protein